MENGPSPQPVPNTVISSTALQAYFKSIEDLFRETRTGLAAADKSPLGNFVLIFVFSLIPLIPYLLSKLAFVLWGPLVTGFRSFHFHVASFWFWWIVSFIASLSMLILVAKFSGPGPESPSSRPARSSRNPAPARAMGGARKAKNSVSE